MFIEKLTVSEYEDVTCEIEMLICDYVTENIVQYYLDGFNDYLNEDITDYMIKNGIMEGWCDQYDKDELYHFIEYMSQNILKEMQIPDRQSPSCYINKQTKTEIESSIKHIYSFPYEQQRTAAWYNTRHSMFSASNLWKLFSTPAQLNSLIYEKCKDIDINININNHYDILNTNARNWGIRYEPLSVMIYEHKNNTKVETDFGCIKHGMYPIGASPDGINTDSNSEKYGTMVEIKNIVNREITGIPKFEYWIQMQIQMETCNLNLCDFIETRFKEYECQEEYENDKDTLYKGIILVWIPKDFSNETSFYDYMPLDTSDYLQWISNKQYNNDKHILEKTIYWKLDEYSCIEVERNMFWFDSIKPIIQENWKVVLQERENGCEHRAPKKRVPKKPSCELLLNENIVSLVKLDENGNTI